jgi:hypothetical protein
MAGPKICKNFSHLSSTEPPLLPVLPVLEVLSPFLLPVLPLFAVLSPPLLSCAPLFRNVSYIVFKAKAMPPIDTPPKEGT